MVNGVVFVLVSAEHQNLFGVDEHLGPVAVSLRREKVPDLGSTEPGRSDPRDNWLYQYRVIVRTGQVCKP